MSLRVKKQCRHEIGKSNASQNGSALVEKNKPSKFILNFNGISVKWQLTN